MEFVPGRGGCSLIWESSTKVEVVSSTLTASTIQISKNNMLKLQIFGYSLTNSFYKPEIHDNQGQGPKTFVDLLHDKFNTVSDPSLRGIPMCSEERILYNLKKTKEIDVAIIVHSQPVFWFFFLDKRDLRVMNEADLTTFLK